MNMKKDATATRTFKNIVALTLSEKEMLSDIKYEYRLNNNDEALRKCVTIAFKVVQEKKQALSGKT